MTSRNVALSALYASDLKAAAEEAARVIEPTGNDESVQRIADEIDNQLQPQKRAYARILEGEMAMARHRIADAVDVSSPPRESSPTAGWRASISTSLISRPARTRKPSESWSWPRAHEGLGAIPIGQTKLRDLPEGSRPFRIHSCRTRANGRRVAIPGAR